jgi:predicted phage terminase large subunit-like protein
LEAERLRSRQLKLEEDEKVQQEEHERIIHNLTDESNYKKRIKTAEKRAAEMTSEEWKQTRRLCKTNLFFLSYSILGYTKLSTGLHGHLCNWIQATRADYRYRLLLLPRGHYKSTIYTIADSIQSALPDDEQNLPWPYCLGPDIRIAITHETKDQSSKFLSEIQNHFLSNEALMALFPECVPNPRKQTINLHQLELPRKSFWAQKTFEAFGVGGRQGNHYNILKPDDIIGEESLYSPSLVKKTNDWVDGLQSFLTSGQAMDRIDFTGTRWLHEDSYKHIIDTYGDQLAIYRRGVEEKVQVEEKGPDGVVYITTKKVPIFPEEYPSERLNILRKNKKRFSAQYLNDPTSDTNDFQLDNLRYYYFRSPKSIVAFNADDNAQVEYNIGTLHKLILLDPAPQDGLIGITVTGTEFRKKIFVLDAIKDTFTTPALIKKIIDLYMKWRCHGIVVEKVNFSSLYAYIFLEAFKKRGIKPKIHMQGVPTNKHKEEKIKALGTFINDRLLHVNEKQEDLIEEFHHFGASLNIHLLDSLWMGINNWKYTRVDGWEDKAKEKYQRVMGNRDKLTGYTPQ